ncbi:MAG: MGMT family protein [Actinomycetota bacterium]
MDELLVERVLLAVEQVPPGRVASYGLIASLVGTGPRQVGRIMREYGSFVPWWRVTSHSGDLDGALLDAARAHWDAEGIAIKPNGMGCRYARYGVDEEEFADAYSEAAARLAGG